MMLSGKNHTLVRRKTTPIRKITFRLCFEGYSSNKLYSICHKWISIARRIMYNQHLSQHPRAVLKMTQHEKGTKTNHEKIANTWNHQVRMWSIFQFEVSMKFRTHGKIKSTIARTSGEIKAAAMYRYICNLLFAYTVQYRSMLRCHHILLLQYTIYDVRHHHQ